MPSYHLQRKIVPKGKGFTESQYICRDGDQRKFKTAEDLAFKTHLNMPLWVEQDPCIFFKMADSFERKNGSSGYEIIVAIPREFDPVQRIEFIRDFVASEVGKKHPVLWAIHNPTAQVEGGEQPHAHIFISSRTLDGIERSPELFFKRYNPKSPELGGCQKSKKYSGGLTTQERKAALVELRKRFADIQNKHLQKHGYTERVSHLSLHEQGISKIPEKHLGPVKSRNKENVILLNEYRDAQRSAEFHQKNASVIDVTTSLARALEERDAINRIKESTNLLALNVLDNTRLELEKKLIGEKNRYALKHLVGESKNEINKKLNVSTEIISQNNSFNIPKNPKPFDLADLNSNASNERLYFENKYSKKGKIDQFDHSKKMDCYGRIIDCSQHYIVAHTGRNHFAIINILEFPIFEYDGLASGNNRLGVGNFAQIKFRNDPDERKLIIGECRLEFIDSNGQNLGKER